MANAHVHQSQRGKVPCTREKNLRERERARNRTTELVFVSEWVEWPRVVTKKQQFSLDFGPPQEEALLATYKNVWRLYSLRTLVSAAILRHNPEKPRGNAADYSTSDSQVHKTWAAAEARGPLTTRAAVPRENTRFGRADGHGTLTECRWSGADPGSPYFDWAASRSRATATATSLARDKHSLAHSRLAESRESDAVADGVVTVTSALPPPSGASWSACGAPTTPTSRRAHMGPRLCRPQHPHLPLDRARTQDGKKTPNTYYSIIDWIKWRDFCPSVEMHCAKLLSDKGNREESFHVGPMSDIK